jgi:hypothetical protein
MNPRKSIKIRKKIEKMKRRLTGKKVEKESIQLTSIYSR